jgi:hypothetical protein
MFYLLSCLQCGDPERPLVMPFGSPEERGKWATGHTQMTGHDRWRVADEAAADFRTAWNLVLDTPKWRSVLLFNAEAVAVKTMAEHVFAEYDAELDRLRAELDGLREVPVEYVTPRALEAAMAADPGREDGSILRETSGERRAFAWRAAAREWVQVP